MESSVFNCETTNTNFWVDSTPELGRVLRANRDILVGEIVLEEVPLVSWKNSQHQCRLLLAYLEATEEVQRKILDMYHPPVEDSPIIPQFVNCLKDAKKLAKIEPFCSFSYAFIYKLFLIANTNAHSFWGFKSEKGFSDQEAGTEISPEEQRGSALFSLASKASHSCSPNCFPTSRQGPFLRYIAVQPIRIGDLITISYLDDLFCTSRQQRQKKLFEHRGFLCRCSRCANYDDTRGIVCLNSSCTGLTFRQPDSPNHMGKWHCDLCSASFDDVGMSTNIKLEEALQRKVDKLTTSYKAQEMIPTGPSAFFDVVNMAATRLSQIHFIIPQVLKLYALWSAGQSLTVARVSQMMARDSIPAPWARGCMVSPNSLRREAAKAAVRALSVMECVYAGCKSGTCNGVHPPIPFEVSTVGYAIEDFKKSGLQEDIQAATILASRYVYFMRLQYGADDFGVLEIEQLIQSTTNPNERCYNPSCGNTSLQTLKRCSRCQVVLYCSVSCQRSHWPLHKKKCKKV